MEFQNLQSLLNRATAPVSEEEARHYCTRFTTLVNQEPDGASRAITLLIGKVQSQNEPVALRAIHVMDQCSKHCGKPFQSQIGKFRFLNELIKLVSPKYAGKQTPTSVRSAIVQQLKLWSTLYKDQHKLLEAYNMLDKTGNTNIKMVESEFSYAVGEDADKAALLAQLLKSKNKQDLETANKMIKDMVAAEGRKIELDAELLKDVALIHNNGRLLAEMLTNQNRSVEEKLLLNELHRTCVGLRPKLYKLAGQLSDSASLSSVVEAGETLNRAIEQCEQTVGGGEGVPPVNSGYQPPVISASSSTPPAPPPAPPVEEFESTTLINLEAEPGVAADAEVGSSAVSMSADEFDDFLATVTKSNDSIVGASTAGPAAPVEAAMPTSLFGGLTLQSAPTEPTPSLLEPTIQPAPVPANVPAEANLLGDFTATPSNTASNSSLLFSMSNGDDDFAAALGGAINRPGTGSAAVPQSLLDDLFSSPSQCAAPLQPMTSIAVTTAPVPAPVVAETRGNALDMLIPGLTGASFPAPQTKPTLSQLSSQKLAAPAPVPVDPLAALNLALGDIQPAPLPPLSVYDSASVKLSLYSTTNNISPGVKVWLLLATNSAHTPIESISTSCSVVGAGYCKLLAPSATSLAPFSPILPPPPIQQVLLTSNATTLSCSLTISSENSPKTCTFILP